MNSVDLSGLTIQQLKDKYSSLLPGRGWSERGEADVSDNKRWKSLRKADMVQYIINHLPANERTEASSGSFTVSILAVSEASAASIDRQE